LILREGLLGNSYSLAMENFIFPADVMTFQINSYFAHAYIKVIYMQGYSSGISSCC